MNKQELRRMIREKKRAMTVEEIEQRRHNYHASDYYGNDERGIDAEQGF